MRSAWPSSSASACVLQQHGGAFAAQFFHNAVKHLPRSRIQPGGGLVKQQHFGRAQERLRQGQPLAHAFRISAHTLAGRLRNAHAREQIGIFGGGLFFSLA